MTTSNLIATAQKYFPKLQVIEKPQSKLMRLIAAVMFFNRGFMTDFDTTIGDTVYVPSMSWLNNNLPVLIHETVHMYDEERIGVWYNLGYLFPQLLVLLMLPLFFIHWYIALPLVILFALPLPALWRANFEKRAYLIQLYVYVNVYHFKEEVVSAALTEYFKDGTYYFMKPWQGALTMTEANALLASDEKLNAMVSDLVSAVK